MMNNGKMRGIRAFLFDLDGTLIDSRLDLVNSVNAMLRETGRQEMPIELIASYVGHGAPRLIASVLGPAATEEQRSEGLAIFLKHYEKDKLKETRAYPGVVEGLRELDGVPMAVLTNKPRKLSEEILEGLGLARYFRAVYGGDSFRAKKPDPAGAIEILQGFGVSAREAAMVGDSDVDVQTARNAGMAAVIVSYGFGQREKERNLADVYVDRLEELASLWREERER
jgi:phosphoglycolate phosphatase